MKLMLGTAQFGLDYGISNRQGRTTDSEVEKILLRGLANAEPFLDTAASYGSSEEVLGRFPSLLARYSIVTKLPYLEKNKLEVCPSFQRSLVGLGVEKVYGLLFHDPQDLLGTHGAKFYQQAQLLKKQGSVQKIGVSVYTVEQLQEILTSFQIDLVQIPLNILDQRFLKNGFLTSLKKAGIEIHVRSVFLQGLLLMNSKTLNPFFEPMKNTLEAFQAEVTARNYSPQAVCLGFARDIAEVDRVIVGVNNDDQLAELVSTYERRIDFPCAEFQIHDQKYLLPSNWKLI